MGSAQTQVIQKDIDTPPGNFDEKPLRNNIFGDFASSLESPLSKLLDCSEEAQEKYLELEAVSENDDEHVINTQHYHDHRDVYDPITKGQYGLYEKPELLAAYFHDLNLDYINNEEQTREHLQLIHTDPAWSTKQCNMHIMREELKILDRYNDYFVNYNDVINSCVNYHISIDKNDNCTTENKILGTASPTNMNIANDLRTNNDSEHDKVDEQTVCKNPLEIPEQQKSSAAAEVIYSQAVTTKTAKKRYVSAIEIPMGNCKHDKNESPIGTCIKTKSLKKAGTQGSNLNGSDEIHMYTHNFTIDESDSRYDNVMTIQPVYKRIHFNMHNHDNIEIESTQVTKSDCKHYAHDTTPTSPSRIHFEADTFEYSDYDADQQLPHTRTANKIEATCLGYSQASKLENDRIHKRGYHIIPAKHGKLTGMFEHIPIPIMIDDGATIGIMPTSFYYLHTEIQKLPTVKPHHTRIHTSNGSIEAHFLIDLPLNIQGVLIQLRLLVCDSQVPAAVLLSRSAMVQLQITHNYNTSELYIPYQSIDVKLNNKVLIPPNTKARCHGQLDYFEKDGQPCHISGRAIFWAHIPGRYKPYVPLLVDIYQHIIVFTVYNRGKNTKTLHAGDRVGCIDIRSKDGSITRNLGHYTLQNLSEYAIFTHDIRFSNLSGSYNHAGMASALEKVDFANESPADQKQNRLIISDKPTKQSLNEIKRLESLKTNNHG